MNRKGSVETLLLVALTLVLAVTSLFIYASFSNDWEGKSEAISEISLKVNVLEELTKNEIKIKTSEAIISNENPKQRLVELNNEDNYVIKGTEQIFSKIKQEKFTLASDTKNNYELKIEPTTITVKNGEDSITREVELCMLFDTEGNYLRDC